MIVALTTVGRTQSLPDKIRGYKVENISLKVSHTIPETDKYSDDFDLYIQLSKPKLSTLGLLAASIDVGADMVSTKQNGTVDMLTFQDVRVNGVAIEVDDYIATMPVKKGVRSTLPKPVTARINLAGAAKTALKELTDSRSQWSITGTAFIFGKFKKLGFSFRRVIPVKIDILVKNPLL